MWEVIPNGNGVKLPVLSKKESFCECQSIESICNWNLLFISQALPFQNKAKQKCLKYCMECEMQQSGYLHFLVHEWNLKWLLLRAECDIPKWDKWLNHLIINSCALRRICRREFISWNSLSQNVNRIAVLCTGMCEAECAFLLINGALVWKAAAEGRVHPVYISLTL